MLRPANPFFAPGPTPYYYPSRKPHAPNPLSLSRLCCCCCCCCAFTALALSAAYWYYYPYNMPTDPATYLYWPYFFPFLWY